VGVGDDELHARESSGHEVSQERGPCRTGLLRERVEADDLTTTLGVHGGCHDAGDLHDTTAFTNADGERVDPQVRVRPVVERTAAEGGDLLVECLGQPRDLRLGDALDAERLHESVDSPGRDSPHIALGDDCHERTLRTTPVLEQPVRVVAAFAQLRDGERDRAHSRVEFALPVAVASVHTLV
jgi:hypothetical protein